MSSLVLLDSKPPGVVLSASQVGTWDLCKRRWAFEYIAKIRGEPHPSAQLGSEVHAHLEAWLRNATPPPQHTLSGRIALRMLRWLPPPGTGNVEQRFYVKTDRGHQYTGFMDWVGWFNQRPLVIDHKTSSNIESYGKTEADLHTDIQAVLYAVVATELYQTSDVQLFWNYGETKGALNTKPVCTLVQRDDAKRRFEIIEDAAVEISYHLQHQPDPNTLPAKPSSCGAFGGCPHRAYCSLTDQERMRGMMNNEPTMAQKMEALLGGGAPQNPTAMATPQGYPQQPQQPQPQQMLPPMATPQGYMPQQPQQPGYAPQQMPPPMATPQGYMPQQPQHPGFQQPGQTQVFQPQQMMPPQVVPGSVQQLTPPAVLQPVVAPLVTPPPQQQTLPYTAETGPNPPEQGIQMPVAAAAEPAKKKGRGPAKAKPVAALNAEQWVFAFALGASIFGGKTAAESVENAKIALDSFRNVFNALGDVEEQEG